MRCLFRHQKGLYEERITVWQVGSRESAIEAAEKNAEQYEADLDCMYLGFAQAYGPLEHGKADKARFPSAGTEVFSLMRRSDLAPDAYISRFYATGAELEGKVGDK